MALVGSTYIIPIIRCHIKKFHIGKNATSALEVSSNHKFIILDPDRFASLTIPSTADCDAREIHSNTSGTSTSAPRWPS